MNKMRVQQRYINTNSEAEEHNHRNKKFKSFHSKLSPVKERIHKFKDRPFQLSS